MSTLEHAIALAAKAHEGQTDKGGAPYVLHALRVMLKMTGYEERIAAVLHDTLEDTPWTSEGLRREGFSETVVEAVECLSRQPNESYEEFIQRVKTNPLARRVKLADLEDNCDLTRIEQPTTKDLARIQKYRRAIAALSDAD